MCPDVLQYLSYFAGRTKTVKLGSMVVVLPWHDPMRVAEQVSMLDHMSDGRFILGLERGLGRVEFEGFGRNQEDSREYFTEAAQMLLAGLESGTCEFDGRLVKHLQLRRDGLRLCGAEYSNVRGPGDAGAESLSAQGGAGGGVDAGVVHGITAIPT